MTTGPEVLQRPVESAAAFERDDDIRRNQATRSGPVAAGLCSAYAEEHTASAAESTGNTAWKA